MHALSARDRFLLLAALMVTQTTGWGTTFSQVGILAGPISDDLGFSRGTIFLGASVLYVFAAVAAPVSGRLADRLGGLRLLVPGSVVLALGLYLLSLSTGPHGYLAPWVLFGCVFHLGLVTATYTGLAQVLGAEAARSIGTLTLATGLCSTIFWPISEALLGLTDWRGVFQVYAGVTLGLCLPLHLLLYRRFGHLRAGQGDAAPPPAPSHIRKASARLGERLMVVVAGFGSFLGVAIGIAAIELFVMLGAERGQSIFAGSLLGVSYVVSRGLATVMATRVTPVRLAQITYAALPLSLSPLLVYAVTGAELPGGVAMAVAAGFGLPAGLVGILKSTLPLYLFGSEAYGARLGRQARWTELLSAAAPFGFTWAMDLDLTALLVGLLALGALTFLATLRLGQMVDAVQPAEKTS